MVNGKTNSTCVLSISDIEAYPTMPMAQVAQNMTSLMEQDLDPILLSFSPKELSDGTMFKAIERFEPESSRLIYQLEK